MWCVELLCVLLLCGTAESCQALRSTSDIDRHTHSCTASCIICAAIKPEGTEEERDKEGLTKKDETQSKTMRDRGNHKTGLHQATMLGACSSQPQVQLQQQPKVCRHAVSTEGTALCRCRLAT